MSAYPPPSTDGPRGRGRTHLALASLWGAAVVAAYVLDRSGSEAFAPYFGAWNPTLTVALLAIPAVASLLYLDRGGWFLVRAPDRRGWIPAFLIATALVGPVVLVDVAGGFGEDINVLLPDALLFYPSIAVVAETVFHVLPLAVLLLLLKPFRTTASRDSIRWACVLIASLPEPVFQVVNASGSPAWATAYVGLHLLVFNVAALVLFRRFDFFTMYSFRFFYYLEWHVIWGFLRLRLLF